MSEQYRCTCLSISRDPLCWYHGDVDKVAHLSGFASLPPPAADAGRSRIDLHGIQEREVKATKGPWFQGPHYRADVESRFGNIRDNCSNAAQPIYDAAFIAHARQDIPDLLAEVSQLAVERENMKRQREVVIAAYESLLQRLRALEQQWRESASYEAENANVQYGQALDQCANDLASLLAAAAGETYPVTNTASVKLERFIESVNKLDEMSRKSDG